jgi:ACS family glucarate transporter-like MFS transporter
VLGITVAMAVLLYLDRFAISVATPRMLDELHLDEEQMGRAVSAFFWVYALAQVPAGWLADRWGGRRMLTLSMIVWSTAMIGVGLAGSLAVLVGMRALLGIGQAGAYSTSAGYLKNWMPIERRGFANGSVSMGGRAGGLLAHLVTPHLMALAGVWGYVTGQWRVVFIVYATLGFVWAVGFWRWFRNTPAEHAGCNAAERALIAEGAATATSPTRVNVSWRWLVRSRNLWCMCLINFAVNVGWIFLVTWLPTYLTKVHGMSEKMSGMLTAIGGLAGMAGCVFGGLATDFLLPRIGLRWARRLPGILAASVALSAYLAASTIDGVYVLVGMFAIVYFFADVGLGTTWAVYQDIGGGQVATVLAITNMCGNLGAAACSQAIGSLAKHGQWDAVFMVSAASLGVALVSWFFVDPTVSIVPPAEASRGEQ